MNEKRVEILEFLSELVSEIYEEQNTLRKEIQQYNQKIYHLSQKIKEMDSENKCSDCENSSREEKIARVEEIQIKIFDLQERLMVLQKRVDKVNKLNELINEKELKEEAKKVNKDNIRNRLRLLETQEAERKRISMDLHDTTVQNLTTLVHKTEFCTKLMDIDVIQAKLELQTMTTTIRNTINELRNIIYDLRPMSIDDLGLVMTIERFAKQMEIDNQNAIPINFVVHNEEIKVLPVINLTLFRIIQETYTNAKKHSKAEHFDIEITYKENEIELEISDDGIGFQLELLQKESKANHNKNFGLSIMQERVNLLMGTMEVQSKQEKGTKIIIKVPIIKEEKYDTN